VTTRVSKNTTKLYRLWSHDRRRDRNAIIIIIIIITGWPN